MRKKMFAPAQLKEKKWRWFISFRQTHPISGEMQSFRMTFDLNRIPDIAERQRHGKRMVEQLNRELLPLGFPFEDLIEAEKNPPTILEALEMALHAKQESCRTRRSFTTFEGKVNRLREYIKAKNQGARLAAAWQRPQCRAAMAWIEQHYDIGNTTYNNYIEKLRSVFEEMVKDNIIKKNPWQNMKLREPSPKQRRTFTDEERITVAAYWKEKSDWMFLGILLQYYCMIRPEEMRGLKFADFDLRKGLVTVRKEVAKTGRERTVTLPEQMLRFLQSIRFENYHINFFVFGWKLEPGARQIAKNYLYNRHRESLLFLRKQGKLKDITGLTWYSWKDTGITNLSKQLSPYKLKDQTGHATLDMLMKYYHADRVNEEVRRLPTDML